MPKFNDAHPMTPLTAEQLRAAQASPPDEFGVSHHDILYSEPENKNLLRARRAGSKGDREAPRENRNPLRLDS